MSSKKKIVNWDALRDDAIETIIQLVHERPAIWDKRHCDYKKNHVKNLAWKEVDNQLLELGFQLEGCL